MNPFFVLFWLLEHWYIVALLAIVTVAAGAFTGLVSVSKIIADLLKFAYYVVDFFVTPKEQIASKILCGLVILAVGISIGHFHGVYQTDAKWKAADAAAQASSHQLDQTIAATADALDKRLAAKSDAADKANEDSKNEYVKELENKLATCGVVPDSALRRLRRLK